MEKDIKVWLVDIQNANSVLLDFLPEKKVFSEFQRDTKTKRAIERNIEIIGEAMNRILGHNPEINITAARKIVDTRNRIAHGYDSVSDEIIWSIVIRDIPILKKEVDDLLAA